jgi:hypothetical protein
MSDWIVLAVSALFLWVFCVLLVLRRQRRLAAMQRQIDRHSTEIHRLQEAYSQLLVRSLNSPKPRKARKTSTPSSDTSQENMTSSIVPGLDKTESTKPTLHVVAPKTSPE